MQDQKKIKHKTNVTELFFASGDIHNKLCVKFTAQWVFTDDTWFLRLAFR